ncbi:MAG: EamA family transporter [Candidatus Heimdallarchaeota archaeon]|nr:EamA family transporter [Candidatus Heimdallarchaeota archaeon]
MSKMSSLSNSRINWLALLTALCWGSGSFFGKMAMKKGNLSPLTGIILRTSIALILFTFLLIFFGNKINAQFINEIRFAWKSSKIGFFQIVFFEGFLAGACGMFLYYLALSRGDLSLVMPLAFLSPFWGTLLSLIFMEEKINSSRLIGLLLTIVGIFTISASNLTFTELLQFRIEYLAILTGICWGVGSFFGKRGMKKTNISSFVGITIRTSTALVFLLIAAFSVGTSLLNASLFPELIWVVQNSLGQFFLILFFEGVIAGFFGMLFYYIAIRGGDLSLVMPVAFTSPFWGTLLALIWQTEIFTSQRIFGMLIIIVGIAFTLAPDFWKPIKVTNGFFDYTPNHNSPSKTNND